MIDEAKSTVSILGQAIKREYYLYMGAAVLFLFVCVFFIEIHPLVLFDQDDWRYIAHYRKPFPLWNAWNPGRIMPEVVMPLCGYIAAYFVTPIVGDYVLAVTVTSAIMVAAGVTVYFLLFNQLLQRRFSVAPLLAVCISSFFIFAHFSLFRSIAANNVYLFFDLDLCCYYFYLLPALLNASLVLYLLSVDDFSTQFKSMSDLKKGMMIVLFYLAIFSNLFCSAILAIYCFIKVWDGQLKMQIKRNWYSLIILLWIISGIFEASGKNAIFVGASYRYLSLPVGETLIHFLVLLKQIDWCYIILTILCVGIALYFYYKSEDKTASDSQYKRLMIFCGSSFGLIFLFLILLCAKVTPSYAGRVQSVFGFYFYGLLIVFLSGTYILQKSKRAVKLFPLILVLFFIMGTNSHSSFSESNTFNQSPYECMAVSRDLIKQAQIAEMNGEHNPVVFVPKGDAKMNWPHPQAYFGREFAHTLYAHGLIHHKQMVTVKIDPEMNRRYYK